MTEEYKCVQGHDLCSVMLMAGPECPYCKKVVPIVPITFEEWFASHDWWKEISAFEGLEAVWKRMKNLGLKEDDIGHILDEVKGIMASEYGE